MIIPNFIPFVVFLILLLYNFKKTGRIITLSNLIIAIYTISAGCFWYLSTLPFHKHWHCSLEALLLVFCIVTVMIIPISRMERHGTVHFSKMNLQKVYRLTVIIMILGWYANFFFLQYVMDVFMQGIVETRDVRRTMYESSIFSKIAILGAFLSPMALFFYFYNKIYPFMGKVQSLLLFLSSISFVFYTLNVAGRDGIIIWILSYIALYCLYKNDLPNKENLNIKITFLIIVICLILVLFFISKERFSNTDAGTVNSMLSYIGQGFENLTYNIEVYHKNNVTYINPLSIFEIVVPILNLFGIHVGNVGTFEAMDIPFQLGYRANQFSFFIGTFYPYGTGLFILILFIGLCYIIYSKNLQVLPSGQINSAKLLIAFTWYMIPIVGVFYFYYGTFVGNVYLLIPFIFYFYLKN